MAATADRPTGHNFDVRNAGCPKCGGTGNLEGDALAEGEPPFRLKCVTCDGSGNRWHALLRRAYMHGWHDGIEAMRNALPMSPEGQHGRMYSNDHLMERLLNDDYADL